jgi:hypothetical protein
MSDYSDYLEAAILDHIFGVSSYTAPTWYVALSTADPLDNGSGLAEPGAGGYTRQALGAVTRVGNEVDNDALVSFTASGGSFGTITHIVLCDAAGTGAGNILGSVALTGGSVTVSDGDTLTFAVGDINITLD